MTALLIIGSAFSIATIFAMFGKVISHSEVTTDAFVSMFEAAFGQNASHSKVTGLLALFILTLFVIVLSVTLIIMCAVNSKYKIHVTFFILSLDFIDTVLALCTLALLDVPSGYGFELGAGPIVYAILSIAALVMFIIAICLYFKRKNRSKKAKIKKENFDTEEDGADLLLKYKKLLDDRAITKEEYNEIKRKILKK